MSIETILVIAGTLLIISVLASTTSSKFGIPALVLFVAVGMLAGSDGLGGIYFDNANFSKQLGITALALILFAGGLDTHLKVVLPVLRPGLALATIGTFVTAGSVGVFLHFIFDFTFLQGLLVGSIVASTDAAAVFGVLRSKGMKPRRGIAPLLELESGSNDPTAIFLTISVAGLILHPETSFWVLIPQYVLEMIVGGVFGALAGFACAWSINRLRLDFDGLYPAITIGTVFLVYGGAHAMGGNGFLAVYVAGLALGSRNFVHRIGLIQFHDALAWIMQIAMFLILGLQVFPSKLPEVAWLGSMVALFLAFIARPAAVFISLMFSKRYNASDKLFISWGGLRGAVPIILAIIPLTLGIPEATLIFNVVFFVVIISVMVQGTTLAMVGKLLGVVSETDDIVQERRVSAQLTEVNIPADSPAVGRKVIDLGLPETVLLVLLTRGEQTYIPRGSTVIQSGDKLLISIQGDKDKILSLLMPAT